MEIERFRLQDPLSRSRRSRTLELSVFCCCPRALFLFSRRVLSCKVGVTASQKLRLGCRRHFFFSSGGCGKCTSTHYLSAVVLWVCLMLLFSSSRFSTGGVSSNKLFLVGDFPRGKVLPNQYFLPVGKFKRKADNKRRCCSVCFICRGQQQTKNVLKYSYCLRQHIHVTFATSLDSK